MAAALVDAFDGKGGIDWSGRGSGSGLRLSVAVVSVLVLATRSFCSRRIVSFRARELHKHEDSEWTGLVVAVV